MKVIIYRRSDNSIMVGAIAENVLVALTGSGGLLEPSTSLEKQISKHLMTVDNQAEFLADWEAFLAPLKGTTREQAIRTYLTFARDGGATEEEAYNAIAGKDMPSEAVDYRVVEESEVHTDRYFRSAWEWED
jgi:hypothetical protein